jgi:hypothetical protein
VSKDKQEVLAERFRHFGEEECRGSSPLYERLSLAAARDPEVLGLLAAARGSQRRPNLLFAAVHYLLLRGDPHPLGRFYPSLGAERARGDPWPVFRDFVLSRRAELEALIARRHTQTNEVRRSAVLYPAIALAAWELGGPVAILEAGAAAGLNLLFDRYWFDYGAAGTAGDPASPVRARCQVRGGLRPPISQPALQVAARLGIDSHPLDIRDADEVLWLRSLVWPEHRDRVELLQSAIAVAWRDPPPLDHGTLPEAVTEAAASIASDRPLLVFHSATLAYLTPDERDRFGALLAEVARDRALAWVAFEGPGASPASVERARARGGLGQLRPAFADPLRPGASCRSPARPGGDARPVAGVARRGLGGPAGPEVMGRSYPFDSLFRSSPRPHTAMRSGLIGDESEMEVGQLMVGDTRWTSPAGR